MTPVAPGPPPADPELEAQRTALANWLAGCGVSESGFVRHKLYTWTRAEQIDELRASARAPLLSRERGAEGAPSLFDQALLDDPHPLARHLRRAGNRARRFAWVAPWATRMGWEQGDYGDRLIEVTLRDEAWTARFDPRATPRWRVVDADGAEIPEDRVARTPERVGAVYHVGDGPRAFREIVLVSEAQIERWAYSTAPLRALVGAEASELSGLAAHLRLEPPAIPDDLDAWLRQGWAEEPSSLIDRYRGCLALGSVEYQPSSDAIEAVAAALRAMPEDDPIERVVPRAPRPAPLPLPSSTWCDPSMGCPP